jgi:uncharacterized protein (TIGR02172 family)
MNAALGPPIDYGRTSEVYAWGEDQVLKLFYNWFSLEKIEMEAWIARAVHASGLPVPAVGEVIRLNGRYGLIYERVRGDSMYRMFQHKPWNVLHYARRVAELQAALHDCSIQADLRAQRQVLAGQIRQAETLPAPLRSRALAALDSMPDGDSLCHGDFWPGNILMPAQGEVVIDWIHASRGNPLADLARTTVLCFSIKQPGEARKPFLSISSKRSSQLKNLLFQIFCRVGYPFFMRSYLTRYFSLRPGGEEEYRRWLPILAAARLSDVNVQDLERILIAQVEKL